MAGLKVAIVGDGTLATLLATRIPMGCRKVIISQKKAAAVALADEVGGLASDQLSAVRGCEIVFLALPGAAVVQTVRDVVPHLRERTLVVNTAVDVDTDSLVDEFPDLRLAAAKLIGHPQELTMGSPGVVILDHVDEDGEETLRDLLDGLGTIIVDDESKVRAVSDAVRAAMEQAEADLRERLERVGLAPDLVPVVITSAGPGVLRSLLNS